MQHLEEGTIHAWLDGALDEAEAARVERHAAECGACAAMVAEARGFIAGASRIVSSLDVVRGGVLPSSDSQPRRAPAGRGRSVWTMLHLTPARAAIAATLLVAVASTLTVREMRRVDTVPAITADKVQQQLPGAAPGAPAPDSVAVPPAQRDLSAPAQAPSTAPAPLAAKETPATGPSVQKRATKGTEGDLPARRLESDKIRDARAEAPAAAAPIPASIPVPSARATAPAPPSAGGRFAGVAAPAAAPVMRTSRELADTTASRQRGIVALESVIRDSLGKPIQNTGIVEARSAFVPRADSMRGAARRDAASTAAGCYVIAGARPAWASAVPERFALDETRLPDSTSDRRVVRAVNGTRVDSPMADASWRFVDGLRVEVRWTNGASGPALTLTFGGAPMTATISDAAHSESIALTRMVCSPR